MVIAAASAFADDDGGAIGRDRTHQVLAFVAIEAHRKDGIAAAILRGEPEPFQAQVTFQPSATPTATAIPSAVWPLATGTCGNNNTTWAAPVQPWLANLKQACPTAYSYPCDDFTSTFQCAAQGATNQLGYDVECTSMPVPTTE